MWPLTTTLPLISTRTAKEQTRRSSQQGHRQEKEEVNNYVHAASNHFSVGHQDTWKNMDKKKRLELVNNPTSASSKFLMKQLSKDHYNFISSRLDKEEVSPAPHRRAVAIKLVGTGDFVCCFIFALCCWFGGVAEDPFRHARDARPGPAREKRVYATIIALHHLWPQRWSERWILCLPAR